MSSRTIPTRKYDEVPSLTRRGRDDAREDTNHGRSHRATSRGSLDDEPDLQRSLELRQRQNRRKEEARYQSKSEDLFKERDPPRRSSITDLKSTAYERRHSPGPTTSKREYNGDNRLSKGDKHMHRDSSVERRSDIGDRRQPPSKQPLLDLRRPFDSRQATNERDDRDHRYNARPPHIRTYPDKIEKSSHRSPPSNRHPTQAAGIEDRRPFAQSRRSVSRDRVSHSQRNRDRREYESSRPVNASRRQVEDSEDKRRREMDSRALDAEREEELSFRERHQLDRSRQIDSRRSPSRGERYPRASEFTSPDRPRDRGRPPPSDRRADRSPDDRYSRRTSADLHDARPRNDRRTGNSRSSPISDARYSRNDRYISTRPDRRGEQLDRRGHNDHRERSMDRLSRVSQSKREHEAAERYIQAKAYNTNKGTQLPRNRATLQNSSPPHRSRHLSVNLSPAVVVDDRKRDHSVGAELPTKRLRTETHETPDPLSTPHSVKLSETASAKGVDQIPTSSYPVETHPRLLTDGSVYDRLGQIGEGTYGKVYKAQHSQTKQFVALKRIRMEQERDGFPITAMREIKLLQRLRAPGVIRLEEMMIERGSVYMVFEYMDHDLTGILANPAISLEPAHIKDLTAQLFDGLGYLHQRGVLHRDIKASNILLNNAGQLKLADFGLARFYHKHRSGADYTNRVITLWFRPPELLLGATAYGPSVDLWSAGCIFLELFTGKSVFPGKDEIHQLESIYHLLGSPTPDTWPDVQKLPWYELVKPKHFEPGKLESDFSKILSPAALDFAKTILQLDPSRRPLAHEVLAHPYFSEEPLAQRRKFDDIAESHEWETKLRRREERAKKAASVAASMSAATAGHASTGAGQSSTSTGPGTGSGGFGPPSTATSDRQAATGTLDEGDGRSATIGGDGDAVNVNSRAGLDTEAAARERLLRADSAELGSP